MSSQLQLLVKVRGVTQAQLANGLGFSTGTVTCWLRNPTEIKVGHLIDIARIIRVPAALAIKAVEVEVQKEASHV